MEDFQGYHSEWNLGNPGGWDYQRLTQTIGKTVWQKFNKIHNFDLDCECTYLLGPVRIALRPRLITSAQIAALRRYGQKLWDDCLTLEKIWLAGELDEFINIEEEELEIARLNPWGGSAAIIVSDGLFDFGAAKTE